MKRTLITPNLSEYPSDIRALMEGAKVYDSSCSPEARVLFIERDNGYFLKRAPKGTLHREAVMTDYFHKKGLSPSVISYLSLDADLLVTERALGEDCTHPEYLNNPKRLVDTLAERLRMLHECDFSTCPVQDRMKSYIDLVNENYKTGNYDSSHFPDSFGYRSAEQAYAMARLAPEALRGRVLLHGDYCLPNIMLDNWRFSAFIDLGGGGVGDRHIDLFWGVWTLGFNLHTNEFDSRFLDAYGRDVIDTDALRIVAACEVFG